MCLGPPAQERCERLERVGESLEKGHEGDLRHLRYGQAERALLAQPGNEKTEETFQTLLRELQKGWRVTFSMSR